MRQYRGAGIPPRYGGVPQWSPITQCTPGAVEPVWIDIYSPLPPHLFLPPPQWIPGRRGASARQVPFGNSGPRSRTGAPVANPLIQGSAPEVVEAVGRGTGRGGRGQAAKQRRLRLESLQVGEEPRRRRSLGGPPGRQRAWIVPKKAGRADLVSAAAWGTLSPRRARLPLPISTASDAQGCERAARR